MNASPWPALDYEPRLWTPTGEFGIRATEERFGDRTYQAAIPPFIATLSPRPDSVAAEGAEEAANELTRFDAELGARVAAFAPVLLRSEAASSSQIENLTANARAIFTADLGAKTGQNAMLIAANTRAMQAAIDLADDLSADAILRMHEVLMQARPRHTPEVAHRAGVDRGRSDSPLTATFVAPHEDRAGAHRGFGGVLRPMGCSVAHADRPSRTRKFETIHPFTDGNGRTGRAFAQALLRHRGVTRNVAVPVSAGLLANVGISRRPHRVPRGGTYRRSSGRSPRHPCGRSPTPGSSSATWTRSGQGGTTGRPHGGTATCGRCST